MKRQSVFRQLGAGMTIILAVFLLGIHACQPPDADGDGVTVQQGDCDDGDASVYPGADELCDDRDNNCSGGLGDYYVDQIGDGDATTIQIILDTIAEGCSVVVAPGHYEEQIIIDAKSVILRSESQDPADTIIDAGGQGTAVEVSYADATEVTGFTITGGDAAEGGGMLLVSSDAVVQHCVMTSNMAVSGGGIALVDSSPIIQHCTISANIASNSGGGLYSRGGRFTLFNTSITENVAADVGGGIALVADVSVINNVLVQGNSASSGGGIYNEQGVTEFTNCRIVGNSADATGTGGGLYFWASSPVLSQCVVVDNTDSINGDFAVGGLYAYQESGLKISNSIFAYNDGYNLYGSGSHDFTYSDFYNPTGSNFDYGTLTVADLEVMTVEPGFFVYDSAGVPVDFHLALTSPLIDAGDDAMFDADGSTSDLGCYGGLQGNAFDLDRDGYFDYFWPGAYSAVPAGVNIALYDSNDSNPDISE